MISGYLKENAIIYSPFVDLGDIHGYCDRNVDGVDIEAEQISIIGIVNYLEIAAEIVQVQDDGSAPTLILPEDAIDDGKRFVAHLLFTPGHYDALFT